MRKIGIRCVYVLLQQSPQRASFNGQSACGGRMVLTGYVTHDLVVIHHKHCKNSKRHDGLFIIQTNNESLGIQAGAWRTMVNTKHKS